MDLSLTGKTALVTCAASGLGAACARRLQAEGAQVIGVRRGPAIGEIPELLDIQWVECDITEAAALRAQVRELSPIDILVFVPVREEQTSLLAVGSADYNAALERSFYPCLGLVQELLPGMVERGYGRFIALFGSSVFAPLWDHTLSNVARMAIVALCSGAAREYAADGISFNNIILGLFDTPGLKALWEARTNGDEDRFREYASQRISQIPGKKMGDPDQCAMLCALLASPAMGHLNGQSIRLDGGLHLGL